MTNRRIVLASRPEGEPSADNFRLETVELAEPGEGEVLLRTLYLSIDPYMRGRMSDAPSYAAPVGIGEVMVGSTLALVVESRAKGIEKGDVVAAFAGWQEHAVVSGRGLRKVHADSGPLTHHLGVLGMPGLTAWAGLHNIGQPKAGETLVVAAASGAVGSVVGQIAKLRGCRAVGIAGGPAKCDFVRSQLGFDECLDHRDPALREQLAAACPNGVDVYFENVGGKVSEAVAPLLNDFARIPVCGLIAGYNSTDLPVGRDHVPAMMRAILVKRLRYQGFIVTDYAAQMGDFVSEMTGWLKEGRVRYREDIVDGLESAPEALLAVLSGRNFGKMLVRF